MCSCEAACVWAWRGRCREGEERVPHACRCGRGSRLAPGHERGATHCVCVCATQPGALCGVCSSRGRGRERGLRERREPARDAPQAAVGHRMCSAVCVRPPGWRRARLGAKEMRVAAQPQVWRAGALPADEKSRNWSSRAGRPGEEPGACVSTGARVPRAGASAARRTRPVKKEKKAAARRAPTAEEAHRMHARNPRSSKRHAAPRARAGGHATRSSDCGCPAGSG